MFQLFLTYAVLSYLHLQYPVASLDNRILSLHRNMFLFDKIHVNGSIK